MTRTRRPLPEGFGTIWTCVALDLVGFGIVVPILPLYAEQPFGASPTVVGLLVASFSVAQLLFAPLWGAVSDRVGRKPVLVVSLAGTAIGSLVTGLAGTLWILFAGRIIDGVSGASVSVAQAAVVDLAPPEERPRLLGLLGAAFGIGFVAGPALGSLAALGGPHIPFLVAAAIAAVNAVVAAFRLPETRPRRRLPRVEVSPPGPAPVATSLLPGTRPAAGQADLACDSRAGEDGAAGGRRPGVGELAAVAFVALVAFSAFETTFALFGERRLGLKLASTGLVFTFIGILIAVVNATLVRPAVRRLGEAGTVRVGLLLNAAGLVVLTAVHSWALLVPALVLLTAGQGLVTPALASAVAGRVAAERRGGALGVQQSAGGLARVVGPVAGGAAFQHVGHSAPYLAGAALMGVAALLVTRSRDGAGGHRE